MRTTPDSKNISPFRRLFKVIPSFIKILEDRINTEILLKNIKGARSVKIAFYACLFTTLLLTGLDIYKYNFFERKYNTQLISKFTTQFEESFHRYFSMIYGVRAVFSMSPDITEKQWIPYSQEIMHPKRYPGIHSVSIIRPIRTVNLTAFLDYEKKLNGRDLTIKSPLDYTLNEMNIVQYAITRHGHHPDGLNIRQYDNSRKALDKTRDDDKSTMIYIPKFSSQNLDKFGPAFIIYAPIYTANTRHTNTLSRRENFYGWVASSIYIRDLFEDVLRSDPDFQKINIRLSVGEKDNTPMSLTPSTDGDQGMFPQTFHKTIAGLKVTLHTKYLYKGMTLYGGRLSIPSSVISLLIISTLITLLTTAFIWSIMTMRQRALDLANRMTTDIFRQEQKYRALIHNAPGVIFSCTPNRNWRMSYLSDQFKEITGYSPTDFLNNKKRYIEIVHPDDILKVEQTIGLKPKANHEYFLDYRIIHENGTVRWMHERAKVVRSPQNKALSLTGHFFDITDQKTKEADYRNLVHALENAVNGVAFINDKGYHLQVNEAYSDIMGGTPKDLQYKSFFDLLNEKDQSALRHLLHTIEDKKRDLLTVEIISLQAKTIYLSLVIVPTYSDNAYKKMTGFYVFAKDISNDILRENQLSEAVKAAEAANQTKSTFLATMSHELRTPLNAIIGYSDMLLEDAQDDNNEILVGDLKKINHSGRHLLTLINDILDVSKLEAGKVTIHLEKFQIKETAQNMLDIIYPAAEQNKNTIQFNITDNIGDMYSDLTKLRQMVFNLLSNACKFTKEGTVTLSIKAVTQQTREFIAFSVADSGIGITDEQMEKLFKPFAQADSSTTRNFGGTGLGLTITKKFSEILGGEIIVTSDYGKGTTFTLMLPRNTRQELADDYNNGTTTNKPKEIQSHKSAA